MADNQEKKLSQKQIQQRDYINSRLEKATNKKISDIFKDDLPEKKAFYYRHVVNMPLKQVFISFILSQFKIDLNHINDHFATQDYRTSKEEESWQIKYEKEVTEKVELLRENKELFDRTIEQKKLIAFYENTIDKLTEELKGLKEGKKLG